jgi:hypothetical protein
MRRRERRKVQRIRFAEPLRGRVRARGVSILDLSTQGACIEHPWTLSAGSGIELETEWNGQPISISATVTRCTLSHYTSEPKPKPVYHSGVAFVAMDEASRANLDALIEHYVRASLAEGREIGQGALPSAIGGMPLEVWLQNKLK